MVRERALVLQGAGCIRLQGSRRHTPTESEIDETVQQTLAVEGLAC
jgi:hypothetical protein